MIPVAGTGDASSGIWSPTPVSSGWIPLGSWSHHRVVGGAISSLPPTDIGRYYVATAAGYAYAAPHGSWLPLQWSRASCSGLPSCRSLRRYTSCGCSAACRYRSVLLSVPSDAIRPANLSCPGTADAIQSSRAPMLPWPAPLLPCAASRDRTSLCRKARQSHHHLLE